MMFESLRLLRGRSGILVSLVWLMSPPRTEANEDEEDEDEEDEEEEEEEEELDGDNAEGSVPNAEGSAAVAGKEERPALKKGPWTSAEDTILMEYVRRHGDGNWNAVPKNSGLLRCGKSCRLRWTNHLRPELKKGPMSEEEERTILHLHVEFGNKWAKMVPFLPGRTDNEIKNFWNARTKRHLRANLYRNLYGIQLQAANKPQQTYGLGADRPNGSFLAADMVDRDFRPQSYALAGPISGGGGLPSLVHLSDESQRDLGWPVYFDGSPPSCSADHRLVHGNSYASGHLNEPAKPELPSFQLVITDPTGSNWLEFPSSAPFELDFGTHAQSTPATTVFVRSQRTSPRNDGTLEAVVHQGLRNSTTPQSGVTSRVYLFNEYNYPNISSLLDEFPPDLLPAPNSIASEMAPPTGEFFGPDAFIGPTMLEETFQSTDDRALLSEGIATIFLDADELEPPLLGDLDPA